ncbi:MAG: pitrilysin family protein [Cyanobacteria bacterium MAG COS1_bin_9]|jgi:predicted Zn-dependent peptidase|nr:pitrilysin family protein [Cyanobacteria bacterium MAG COS1_bin_9]MDC3011532.1 insulinase family protein [Synechococcus sp. AH-736-G21]|tara:strand:- start:84 stop:1340 length:1257 start_codon:yes stop_codon:yes gene_type:complete
MSNPELLIEPVSSPGILAAKLLLPFGSADDPAETRGAHDLLASLLSRGCGRHNHVDLADLVEGCGAGLRCDAQEDALVLSLRCTVEDAEQLLPLLAQMVRSPRLEPGQVALERSLTIQALQRQREDPFHCATTGWRQLTYGNGGYGHDPMGIAEELDDLDREALLPLAERLPRASSVLALAGSVPPQIIDTIGSLEDFRDWPEGSGNDRSGRRPYAEAVGTETIQLEAMDTEQVVLMLGQATLGHGHPDELALRLLQCHLGVGMSSLLFQRLREDHGVAYDVAAHFPALAGPAPFVLMASSVEERSELALDLLLNIWDELSEQPLSEAALELARAKYIGQLAQGLQTCSQRAERRVQLKAQGLPDDHDQRCVRALAELTPTDVLHAAQRWLREPRLSLCGTSAALKQLERRWDRRDAA